MTDASPAPEPVVIVFNPCGICGGLTATLPESVGPTVCTECMAAARLKSITSENTN